MIRSGNSALCNLHSWSFHEVGWLVGRRAAGQESILETAMSIWDPENKCTNCWQLFDSSGRGSSTAPPTTSWGSCILGVEYFRCWNQDETDCAWKWPFSPLTVGSLCHLLIETPASDLCDWSNECHPRRRLAGLTLSGHLLCNSLYWAYSSSLKKTFCSIHFSARTLLYTLPFFFFFLLFN